MSARPGAAGEGEDGGLSPWVLRDVMVTSRDAWNISFANGFVTGFLNRARRFAP
jgi:hypothetical protein